jgi:membrane protein
MGLGSAIKRCRAGVGTCVGTVWQVLKATIVGFVDDRAMTMGAAMAYYTLFSLAPVLVIVIAVAGLVFGHEAARGAIVGELSELLGQSGAEAVNSMIASAWRTGSGVIATVVGVATFILGATTALGELQDSLNVIWRAPAVKGSTILAMLRNRLLTLSVVLGLGFLLLVSLVIGAGLTAFSDLVNRHVPDLDLVIGAINFGVSFLVTTVLFALIYRVLPRVVVPWWDVIAGALLAGALFMLGRWAIAFYLGQTDLASTFGAASTVIVVMIWVYYSSQIIFLGAEFARALGDRRAARRAKLVADAMPPAA